MSDENDISKYKTEEHINFMTIPEGEYKGVSYKINNAQFVEKDGKDYLELDYDVQGLDERDAAEFEKYIGDTAVKALEWAIEKEKLNDENQI